MAIFSFAENGVPHLEAEVRQKRSVFWTPVSMEQLADGPDVDEATDFWKPEGWTPDEK